MQKKNRVDLQKLYQAILSLNTEEECAAFLEDICTIQELEEMAQRLDVAKRLYGGESYIDINAVTGVSTATIGRVSRALNYGTGGYASVIERLGEGDTGK